MIRKSLDLAGLSSRALLNSKTFGSTINIIWDNKLAIYYLDALTKEKMITNIESVLLKNPKPSDFQKAAVYYYEEGLDKEKAFKWINRLSRVIKTQNIGSSE